jgi:hypothetical protein
MMVELWEPPMPSTTDSSCVLAMSEMSTRAMPSATPPWPTVAPGAPSVAIETMLRRGLTWTWGGPV